MGLFNTILQKLGLAKDAPASTPTAVVSKPSPTVDKGQRDDIAAAKVTAQASPKAAVQATPQTALANAPVQASPKAVSQVDVVKKLEQLSAGSGLDWKVSIVDLLKLLNIDSSREARNSLATELGCPPELMSDSAKMNTWLHKTVLQKIADNGGNIPQSLLK